MSLKDNSPNDDGAVRLSKRLAEQLQCSRAEAELYIENGAVSVDGVVVEHPGARVHPQQEVHLMAGAKPEPAPPVTILLHKPAGYSVHAQRGAQRSALDLLTLDQWNQGDTPAPIRVLQKHFQHLECLEPLPLPASGLTVWTQDRRVARKLQDDALYLEQECIAHVQGTLDEEGLER